MLYLTITNVVFMSKAAHILSRE